MLTICAWVWGNKYGPDYIANLQAGLKRHLTEPFRFFLARPCMGDENLIRIKGCFARLRMFDPQWQSLNQLKDGDRVVCIDLDTVITGPLDPLFYRPEPFLILQGANAANPCPYNGSLWMLRAGYRPDVWSDFSIDAAVAIPHHKFPDDQGWLWHKLPNAAGWKVGPRSGVYAFQKPGWPKGNDLPADARIVAFPGWRDPMRVAHLPWVREHWQA